MIAILAQRKGSLKGRKQSFNQDLIRLGRKPDNHLSFAERAVSSYHAEIRRGLRGYVLVDLDSTNGTFVNGKRIREVELKDSDEIELGEGGPVFEFRSESPGSGRGPRIVPLSGEWKDGLAPRDLQRGRIRLGRGLDNDIVVGRTEGSVVSGEHLELRVHSDYCQLEDLGSTNGTFVNGSRVRGVRLQDGDRVEIGEGGPAFEFQWRGTRQGRRKRHSESDRMFHKLERAAAGGPAGDRTMMFLNAAQKYYKRRRWPLIAVISVVLVIALAFGVIAYRKDQENRRLTQLAETLFYRMRAVEAQLVAKYDDLSQEERRTHTNERMKMEQDYDQYLEAIGLYQGKSEVEKAVMRLARSLGETDLEVPPDFHKIVMQYVDEWRSTPTLRNALDYARQRQLPRRIALALDSKGLPRELFFIALQESKFDARAVGPATRFGIAKGMWQFIPSTATQYNLQLGPYKDERRYDPSDQRHDENLATVAAARYLAYLYSSKAAASGLLVIASYNFGETRIISRLDQLPNDPRVRSFWNFYRSGWLPEETRDYVLKIFAAALICEKPHLFNISMAPCTP